MSSLVMDGGQLTKKMSRVRARNRSRSLISGIQSSNRRDIFHHFLVSHGSSQGIDSGRDSVDSGSGFITLRLAGLAVILIVRLQVQARGVPVEDGVIGVDKAGRQVQ